MVFIVHRLPPTRRLLLTRYRQHVRQSPRAGIVPYRTVPTTDNRGAALHISDSTVFVSLPPSWTLLQAFVCMHACIMHPLSHQCSQFLTISSSIHQRLPKRSLHALSRQALISFHVAIATVELSRLVKVTLSSMPASRRFMQLRICARFSTARPLASTW